MSTPTNLSPERKLLLDILDLLTSWDAIAPDLADEKLIDDLLDPETTLTFGKDPMAAGEDFADAIRENGAWRFVRDMHKVLGIQKGD